MKNETINSRCSGSKIEEEEENVKEIVAEARNENEIEEAALASAPAIAQEEEENIAGPPPGVRQARRARGERR